MDATVWTVIVVPIMVSLATTIAAELLGKPWLDWRRDRRVKRSPEETSFDAVPCSSGSSWSVSRQAQKALSSHRLNLSCPK